MNIDDCFKDGLLKRIRPDKEAAKREIEKAKEYLVKAKKNEEIKSMTWPLSQPILPCSMPPVPYS